MKAIKYIFLSVVSSLALTACMDNYESLPADEFTTEYLFSTTDSVGKQARQYLNSIYDIMENGHTIGSHTQVRDIIMEEAQVYFDDGRSIEETAKIIQNRVQLYLDENS